MSILIGEKTKDVRAHQHSVLTGTDLLPSPPGKVPLFSMSKNRSLTQQLLRHTIPYVALAQSEGKYVQIGQSINVHHIVKSEDALPIYKPSLAISFNGPIDAANQSILDNIGYESSTSKGKTVLLIHEYTMDELRQIYRMRPIQITPCNANTINLDAMTVLITLAKIVKVFCTGMRYYHDIEACNNGSGPIFSLVGPTPTVLANQAVQGATNTFMGVQNVHQLVGGEVGSDKVTSTPGQMCAQWWTTTTPAGVTGFKGQPITSTSGMKHLPGLFLPFIQYLSQPDYEVVPRFLTKYAYMFLEADPATRANTVAHITGNWGLIARTSWGAQMAHLLVCLMAALDDGASFEPIIQGKYYLGSVIQGSNLELFTNYQYHPVQPWVDLKKTIDESPGHISALTAILTMCDQRSTAQQITWAKPAHVTSMRQLREEVLKFAWTDTQRDQIMQHAGMLSFDQKPWPINTYYCVRALELIQNTNRAINQSWPLHYTGMFSQNRVELVLGCFGAQAPSFTIPGAPMHRLAQGRAMPDTKKGGLVVRPVPLATAILNIENFLVTKVINNFPTNLNSRLGDKRWEKRNQTKIWNALGDIAGVAAASAGLGGPTTAPAPPAGGSSYFGTTSFIP